MKNSHRYTLIAAGVVAALPPGALAHNGPHTMTTDARLSYSESYTRRVKGGQEVGSEFLQLEGHFRFNQDMGLSDMSPDTPYDIMIQGKPLAAGKLGDAIQKKFKAKSGVAVINTGGHGRLKFTWSRQGIRFTLTWRGEPALAAGFKDHSGRIDIPKAPIDIMIGKLHGYFDVPTAGLAKTNQKSGATFGKVVLKGRAKSAGLNTVDRDADTYTADVDCNDFDVRVHPGAQEATLDGVDSNCDGRDSGVAQVVETFKIRGSSYSSPVVNFRNASQPGPGTPQYGPLRDFTGYNKSFEAPVGKTSFYDPTTGIKWNDDTIVPASDGQDIWRGWTHTGKWSFLNGAAGDRFTLSVQRAASEANLKGAHPGFILFWRPEGAPLFWAGTQDLAAGQTTLPADSDIVVGHVLVQRADYTLQGLPKKADHRAPVGVDTALYPMKDDSYTLYYVDSGYDADLYDPAKQLIMHPTALKALALTDGVAGSLSKTITLPKTGYYLLYTGNVLEVADWGIGTDGKLTTRGETWDLPAKGVGLSITLSKP
ncbi:putative metal-binding motif-containing protein [Candidatus Methylocalor cossyra]|uniref:Surface-associated protein n=1 Tax=Candidatus Methylocalor cossyra TaxID=3108543 RepID=A0ABP1C621_9GAMM